MKEIVVLSGKGGTGKTTLATSLFASLPKSVLADCDVDAPDTAILLNPREVARQDFIGARKVRINNGICRSGSACAGVRGCISSCRFDALDGRDAGSAPVVREARCEGCGVCAHLCPVQAMTMQDGVAGSMAEGQTAFGPLVHARLKPGEETSGKLVAEVRRRAKDLAVETGADYLLIDGSPGIGCPVISSLTGADRAVLVTEPSLSALRDLERLVELLARFRIPPVAVINKWDLSPELSGRVEDFCSDAGIPVLMKIPFDTAMVQAVVNREIPALVLPDLFEASGFADLMESLC